MKKVFNVRNIITLGFLLALVLFVPAIVSQNSIIAYASDLDEKKPEIKLNLKSKSIVRGKDFSLKLYNLPDNAKVTYKSSDPDIVSVNNSGIVTANKVGSATISVTIKSDTTTSLTCDITVGPPAVSIKSNKSRVVLGIDESDILKLILKPSNTTEEARFSSYNEQTATISSGGRITGKSLGHTYVFAEIGDSFDGTRKFVRCGVLVIDANEVKDYAKYFEETTELANIPDSALNRALDDYFNSEGHKSVSSFNIFLRSIFDFNVLSGTEPITMYNLYKLQVAN